MYKCEVVSLTLRSPSSFNYSTITYDFYNEGYEHQSHEAWRVAAKGHKWSSIELDLAALYVQLP